MRGRSPTYGAAWCAIGVAPLAYVAAFVGSELSEGVSSDARFVAVVGAVSVWLAVARTARPSTSPRARWAIAGLGLSALGAFIWPHSALAVGWLLLVALVLALDALVHAGWIAWRLPSALPTRVGLVAIATLPGAYLLYAFGVVVALAFVTVAPLRLAYLRDPRDPGEEELRFHAEDGLSLGATYTAGVRGAGGVVLVHGVGGGRSQYRGWARRLAAAGYHALRVDLRGHGTSDGAISTYGQDEARDVRAAVDALRARRGVDPSRIVVVAASMGGGAALSAAPTLPQRGVRALLLLAPASDFGEIIATHGPPGPHVYAGPSAVARAMGQIPLTSWRPADALDGALAVLVFHGDRDTKIPLRLSRRLAASPAVTLRVLPGVEHDFIHDDIAADGTSWRRVEAFLALHLGRLP